MATIMMIYLAGCLLVFGILLADPPSDDILVATIVAVFGSWLVVGMAVGILLHNQREMNRLLREEKQE